MSPHAARVLRSVLILSRVMRSVLILSRVLTQPEFCVRF